MISRQKLTRVALLILSVLGSVGCMPQWTVSPTTGTADGTADLTTLGAMLATAEYRNGAFTQMDPKPYESTATLHRFKLPAPAGKATSLVVKEQSVQTQTMQQLNHCHANARQSCQSRSEASK